MMMTTMSGSLLTIKIAMSGMLPTNKHAFFNNMTVLNPGVLPNQLPELIPIMAG